MEMSSNQGQLIALYQMEAYQASFVAVSLLYPVTAVAWFGRKEYWAVKEQVGQIQLILETQSVQ